MTDEFTIPKLKVRPPHWVFHVSLIPAWLVLGFLLFTQGVGQHWSIKCPMDVQGGFCENPFYEGCNWMDPSAGCAETKLKEKVCLEDPGLCRASRLPAGYHAGRDPPKLLGVGEALAVLVPVFMVGGWYVVRRWRRAAD